MVPTHMAYAQEEVGDLSIDSVIVSPDPASTTRGSSVLATITNTADPVSVETVVRLTDSSNPGGMPRGGNSRRINTGTHEYRLINIYPRESGTKHLHVYLDVLNECLETDENNNISTREVEVAQPPQMEAPAPAPWEGDLSVEGVTIDPSPASTTRGSSVMAAIRNTGRNISTQTVVFISDSPEPPAFGHIRGNVRNIRSGANEYRLINAYPREAGRKYVHVLVDAGANLDESNENNNVFTQELEVSAPPQEEPWEGDLSVVDITVDPLPASTSRGSSVQANIRNTGRNISTQTVVFLSDSPDPPGFGLIRGNNRTMRSGANEYRLINIYPREPGTKYVHVLVDAGAELDESDENNNVSTLPIEVAGSPPDIVIKNISIESNRITYGRGAWVSFTVKNTGVLPVEGPILSQKIVVKDGVALPRSGYIRIDGGLAPGGEKTKRFKVGHDAVWPVGDYSIQLEADYQDQIQETSENNNLSRVIAFNVVDLQAEEEAKQRKEKAEQKKKETKQKKK